MKRLFDLLFVIVAAPVCVPAIVLVSLLIRLKLGTPIFFVQTRPGRYGKPFGMIKFRTMLDVRDAQGQLLPDADRLTSLGRVLRASSLDELPELWNVLRGDMSLVGPRPLLMEYLPLYDQKQARRHEVRPGITGWAQINGRNAISWEEKFALDVWYVDNQSLWLDVRIVGRTLMNVVRHHGVSAEGEVTISRFKGGRP